MIYPKFSKGDRVRLHISLADKSYKKFNLKQGDTGSVMEDDYIPFVMWDRAKCNCCEYGTAVREENLKLI